MRKIFTLFAAVVCSITMFAQSLQLETKSGQVIANGSTVTIEGEMVDMYGAYGQFESNLYVRNLTESNQGVYAEMKAVTGDTQICWGGGCVPVMPGNSHTTGMGLVGASSSTSLLIDNLVMTPGYMEAIVTRTIEITVWTDKKPEEKISATVTFTNDPEVLAAGVESAEVNTVKVYANGNVLYYSFADATDRQLQVFDVTGHLQKDIRLTSEAGGLSLEGMTKGLYIYRVAEAGKKIVSGKFLVK